jgi:Fe-S-cluster containining protein
MQYIPWQNVADWQCKGCGYCCKLYAVVLNFSEYLRLTQMYGQEAAVTDLSRFYIKRHSDGTCAFLGCKSLKYYCGLQGMKPEACKIWPFKVTAEPKYGDEERAAFDYNGHDLFVYVDKMCNGVRYGTPTSEFKNQKVREFVELSLGVRDVQHQATGRLGFEWRR